MITPMALHRPTTSHDDSRHEMQMRLKPFLFATTALLLPLAAAGVEQQLHSAFAPVHTASGVLHCDVLSGRTGIPTGGYSTVAENDTYTFVDPLPPEAIVSNITVGLYTLAACDTPKALRVVLNPDATGAGFPLVEWHKPSVLYKACDTSLRFAGGPMRSPSLITPQTSPYIRGGTNTITILETGDGCSGAFVEWIASVTIEYYIDPPLVSFDLNAESPEADKTILMHRFRTDHPFPSKYQIDRPPNHTGPDPVLLTGTVTRDNIPQPSTTLYFRAIDPPNEAAKPNGVPFLMSGASVAGGDPTYWDNSTSVSNVAAGPNTEARMRTDDFGWWSTTTDDSGRF